MIRLEDFSNKTIQLTYVESEQYDPYRNLAIEEYLRLHLEEDECILYLWQNDNTVVIGKNQNVWKECNISSMEEDQVHLVRRLSGGGTVYHDRGNLNFTFITGKEIYSEELQLEVIIRALEKLGISAQKTGRNDICIDEKKCSGNAFYEKDERCIHHGTIMVDVNKNALSKYLNVSKEKLRSKGIDSVRSRVTNLKEYQPNLTIEKLKQALYHAFSECYGGCPKRKTESSFSNQELDRLTEEYASWEWNYGRRIAFENEWNRRFTWGEMTLLLQVNKGQIQSAQANSDALKTDLIEAIPHYLTGQKYQKDAICCALREISLADDVEEEMLCDMLNWIQTIEF